MLPMNVQNLLNLFGKNLLLLLAVCHLGQTYFVDYAENTEHIQQRAGHDVKLQCNLKELIDERELGEIKIHWFFKQCQDNDCFTIEESDWTPLPCEKIFCKSELLLRNVTEKYSGLYKCTVYPYRVDAEHSLGIQLVRTYHLKVKNTSLAAPEILDAFPINKTAFVDTQVVFQCRVHSEDHPTIKWFRRLTPPTTTGHADYALLHATNGNNFSTHIVRYNGRTYELQQTDAEKLVGDSIYLSKLKLNGVRVRDEGYYACVAISYRGHNIREAYLRVQRGEEPEYWSDYDENDEIDHIEPQKFWLLFLMPLGLAALPLTVWCGYTLYRRCNGHDSQCQQIEEPHYSDDDVDTERCVLGR